ncbi:MAG: bifunctional (p)ppGpp synthetase/guanosine-3',5'-bis(diphosphate) 3'-pyrophosphohydrolase [Bacteroidales bacterium]|nr:bifunctional (p)ppGpp synthetase/guanosine-3',5'-bis(diphosphate) 3'-pyrophosphohydrolase [Bacteroidales bacterium]
MANKSDFTQADYDLINREYSELKEMARKRCRYAKELDTVQKAFEFAHNAHLNIRRRSGEPYILHPIAVAKIVIANINLGYKSICAALLHDVVEDTDYTVEDIRTMFSDKIASLVDGLTKIKTILDNDSHDIQSLQAENFRRILLTLNDDARVVLIKLADRLHNCRTIEFMPEQKRDKILSETMYIFVPLAHRLGLYTIKTEMENIWLRFKEPQSYNEITQRINLTLSDKDKEIDDFIAPIRKSLEEGGFKFEIEKRVKSPYSIWYKMTTKNIDFDQIYDLYAVRIIFESTGSTESERDMCYHIFSKIISLYNYKSDRLRDWVKFPKSNGYEALHVTVMNDNGMWVEVQIRSRRMHNIAEKGIAAHWIYKRENENEVGESETEIWFKRIQSVLANPDINSLELLDLLHNDMVETDISVFTPKGDTKKIRKGATVLDFAYAIHTSIGHRAIAAKVNHRLVPLSTILQNGDQAEIITAAEEKPQKEWLNFLISGKARKNVLDYFKSSDPSLKITVKENKDGEHSYMGFLKIFKKKKDTTIANGEYIFNIAECCRPIPGDAIMGFWSEDRKSITIHKKSCPKAQSLASTFGDRIVIPQWSQFEDKSFNVRISLKGLDRVGILNDVSRYVAYVMGLSFSKVALESKDGIFKGYLELKVKDKHALDTVISKLSKIDGMQSVVRTDL